MRFVVLYNANGQRVGMGVRASANGRSQLSCWCGCASDSGSMLVHYGCPDVLTCVVKSRRLVLMSEAPDIGMGRCCIWWRVILTAPAASTKAMDTHNTTAVVGIAVGN